MFWNYLVTALRNHLNHPGYSLVSVIGLMLGLAAATLVFLHLWQETHYDHHLPDAERLHLVEMTSTLPGRSTQRVLSAPGALAESAEQQAGVELATRLWIAWYTVSIEDRLEFNDRIGAADPELPGLLDLQMLEGDRNALANPSGMMVSASMARRLFGDGPYLGRRVTFSDTHDLEITAVYEDMPQASHLAADILVPLTSRPVTDRVNDFDSNWQTLSVLTYLRLAPGADPGLVGKALQELLYDRIAPPDGVAVEDHVSLELEALLDLHLNGKNYVARPRGEAGNPVQLLIAASVAALILLVACINTVNIATARSADRAHEVAMRKVVGARQGQLVMQFLGESALLVLAATLGALVIVELAAGPVGDFVGRDLGLELMLQPAALLAFGGVLLAVTLLSGLYPAFVLARYRPHDIFQPVAMGGAGSPWSLRTVLVVFQFTASITLTILAGVVWGQVKYLESADLGFEKSGVVLLHGVRRDPQGTITLTQRIDQALAGRPGIEFVAAAHSSPSWDYADEGRVRMPGQGEDAPLTVDRLSVDLDFFSVMGVDPVAGRVFSDAYGPDRSQWDLTARDEVELPVVLNQTAAESLGFGAPVDAVGQALVFEPDPGDRREARVVGVVPDFHFKSLKSRIAPMLFFPDPTRFNLVMVRIDARQSEAAMDSIEAGWAEAMPSQALSWDSLDRELVSQYVAEQRQFTLLAALAFIAIFIATLGLFGLLAHVISGRRREISLRKVMGAELGDVLRLFLWQFSRPVLVAMVLAWPVAWLLASRWLEGFAYRADLSLALFVTAGLAALTLTWGITAVQVVRVAGTSPATVLRAA